MVSYQLIRLRFSSEARVGHNSKGRCRSPEAWGERRGEPLPVSGPRMPNALFTNS